MTTTLATLSQRQINTLRREAAEAGDLKMVAICELALNGWSDAVDMGALSDTPVRNQDSARREVVKAIRAAEAMAD
jgi:hypothetical protein